MGNISKDINSTFSNKKIKALINIKYTANWLQSLENDFFKPYEISPQQFNILRILRGAKTAIKAQTVKERMVERAPNATRLLDKLSDKKLIERSRCKQDKRVVYVSITKQGLAMLTELDNAFTPDFLGNLSEKEATVLSDLLDKLRG